MKKQILAGTIVALGILGTSLSSFAQWHGGIISVMSFDISASVGRLLTTAVKYFLSDDTDIIAELVWDDESGCSGGAGGCYGGSGTAISGLSAALADISVDADIYGEDVAVAQKTVGELAKSRMQTINEERETLDDLKHDELVNVYRSQQRSIQALSDALVMKKAYASLKGVVGSLPSDYSGYTAAASSIASSMATSDT